MFPKDPRLKCAVIKVDNVLVNKIFQIKHSCLRGKQSFRISILWEGVIISIWQLFEMLLSVLEKEFSKLNHSKKIFYLWETQVSQILFSQNIKRGGMGQGRNIY